MSGERPVSNHNYPNPRSPWFEFTKLRIPTALGHRFRRHLGTNSDSTWAPIPTDLGTDSERTWAPERGNPAPQ
jgi:hypothetical protein